jgi:iron(III) transport system permease protein
MWLNSLIETLLLIVTTTFVAGTIGTITAISAWWSNKLWAYYIPLFILGVPPWLFSYYISDFGYIDPWIGASLSLGICCSVYPHAILSSSLANRAYKSWEMLVVSQGKNFKSMFLAIWPSLKLSILPSTAIIMAEVIADFGVSNFYGLNTITMSTYNVWTSTWDLSHIWNGIIILGLLGILVSQLNNKTMLSLQSDLNNRKSIFWAVVSIVPTIMLITFGLYKSINWIYLGADFHEDGFVTELINTLYLTLLVILVCLVVSFIYLSGVAKNFLEKSGLGFYALPGTLIGAAILYCFGAYVPLLILLIVGISIRYYGLIINSVSVADRSNKKYFEVVDCHVENGFKKSIMKARIILPSIVIGICLIILDVIRELPISMILQPMNFQTLAMRMNYIARNENIPMLGPHSIVILVVGIILSSLIIKIIYDSNKKSKL